MFNFISIIVFTFLSVVQNAPKVPESNADQFTQVETDSLQSTNLDKDLVSKGIVTNQNDSIPAPAIQQNNLENKTVEQPKKEINKPDTFTGLHFKDFIIGGLMISISGLFFFGRNKLAKQKVEKNQLLQKNQEVEQNIIALNEEIEKLKTAAIENQTDVLDKNIVIPGKMKKVIRVGDILYIQSQKNAIQIITKSERFWVWQTLNKFYSTLPSEEFCRTQRSFIVNLNEIASYSKSSITLKNKEIVKIGDAYRVELFKKLTSKMNEN